MIISPDLQTLIAEAVAAGRVRHVPEGVRALPVAVARDQRPKAIADTCGRGRLVSRSPRLDQYDRDAR